MILFLSDTYGGRVHDLRIADATPYPLSVVAGSGLPGLHAALGGDPHADQEATRPGTDPGAATGQPGRGQRHRRVERGHQREPFLCRGAAIAIALCTPEAGGGRTSPP